MPFSPPCFIIQDVARNKNVAPQQKNVTMQHLNNIKPYDSYLA